MPFDRPQNLVLRLESQFRESLLALFKPRPGDGLVAAFSGGADSTGLLYLCLSARDELDLKLSAAHLDHGLRGSEGERDRRAAQAAAERAGVWFFWDRVDCRALAREESLSLEEAARKARYAFLEGVRAEAGAKCVATGHTADDNAEAVLLNLLRGSGPQGLSGIPPIREGHILRPLLGFWREELVYYLTARGISWVEDSSNLDQNLTRNRVRHDLLPRLKRDYNPAVKAALVRTAALIRDEESVWEGLLTEMMPRIGWEAGDGLVRMSLSGLSSLDRAWGRRLVRRGVKALKGRTALTLDHVDAVLDLALKGREGRGLDLPGRLRAWVEGDRLMLGRPARAEEPLEFDRTLSVPGWTRLAEAGLCLKAEIIDRPQDLDLKSLGTCRAAMDLDRLTLPLRVRNRRPGDRFQPLGLEGTQKVKKLLIEAKVPPGQRPKVPLVLDQRGIIWVGGLRVAESARVGPRTRRALLLTLEPAEQT